MMSPKQDGCPRIQEILISFSYIRRKWGYIDHLWCKQTISGSLRKRVNLLTDIHFTHQIDLRYLFPSNSLWLVKEVLPCRRSDLDKIGQAQIDAACFLWDLHVADGDVWHDGQHQWLERLVETIRKALCPWHLEQCLGQKCHDGWLKFKALKYYNVKQLKTLWRQITRTQIKLKVCISSKKDYSWPS